MTSDAREAATFRKPPESLSKMPVGYAIRGCFSTPSVIKRSIQALTRGVLRDMLTGKSRVSLVLKPSAVD